MSYYFERVKYSDNKLTVDYTIYSESITERSRCIEEEFTNIPAELKPAIDSFIMYFEKLKSHTIILKVQNTEESYIAGMNEGLYIAYEALKELLEESKK